MRSLFCYISALMLAVSVCSCEDNSNVGNSLSDTTISVVADSSFTVTGHSVAIPRVKARTIVQLLGEIKADNYGELTSDVVSEMMPVGSFVTDGVTEETIDRMRLVMYVTAGTGFTGDSIVPMQMSVYKLNKQLPNPIYSDFNPADYYNESDLLGTATYTASDMDKSTAEREKHLQSYYDNATYSTKYYELREARVELPVEIGRSIFREFKNNPSTFSSPDEFAKFFPGFYIKNSFGSGRVMNFQSTEIEMFYHRKYKTEFGTDTIVFDSIGCLAVTPEILVNNIINMKVDKKLQQQVADGEALLVAPQGYQVDLKLPIRDIVAKYNLDSGLKVIKELRLEIPAETIENDYGIEPPSSVMLIRTSEKDDFFNENQLTDGCRSYVGYYDSTNHNYVFSGLREYVIDVLSSNKDVTDDDENISLIPVDITSESVSSSYSYYYSSASSVLTKVAPAVARPAMARLNLAKAKIRLTYSKKK